MARQDINRGSEPGDGTGGTLYDEFGKVINNFDETYQFDADLGDTAAAKGASMVAVETTSFTATDVQGALEEVETDAATAQTAADTAQSTANAAMPTADLASTANGDGAALVAVETGGPFTATEVQGALEELEDALVELKDRTLNVLDYGAQGDGVADDTAAIDTAIAAAAGRGLYFPAGTYNISSLAEFPHNTHLYGDGIDRTIIFKASGTTSAMIFVGLTKTGPLTIKDMTFDGDSISDQNVIHLGATTSDVLIQRVKIINASTERPALRHNADATCRNVVVKDCVFQGCLYGAISVQGGGGGSRNFDIVNNTIIGCGGSILHFVSTHNTWNSYYNVNIEGNKITECADTGAFGPIPMEIWGTTNSTINNNFIDSGTRGLSCGYSSINMIVSGNTVQNQQSYGVEASDCRGVRLSNNVFQNCNKGVDITSSANSSLATVDMIIEGNLFIGSGVASESEDGSPTYAIRTLGDSTTENLIIRNNVFKNRKFDRLTMDLRGCDAIPTFTFGGGGSGATATSTMNVVTANIINTGTEYTSAPTITINNIDGNGSGATATCTVSNGRIATVTITVAGTGYTSRATVTLTGGTSDNITTQGEIELVMGIATIDITDGGTGYSNASITITKGSGLDAAATFTQTGGVIDDTVNVTDSGEYYGRISSVLIEGNTFLSTEHNTALTGAYVDMHNVVVRDNYFLRTVDYDRANTYAVQSGFIGTSNKQYSDPAPFCLIENNTIVFTGTGGTFLHAIYGPITADVYGTIIRNNRFHGKFTNFVITSSSTAGDTQVYDNDFSNVVYDGTLVSVTANTDIDSKITTFSFNDPTPSVGRIRGKVFKTNNIAGTIITDFDNSYPGQEILILINDANTTIDFTASGLKGNGGVDWVPASGDSMRCIHDGTDWWCTIG